MARKYKLIILAVGLVVVLIIAAATTAMAAQKARTAAATPTNADYAAWGCPMLTGNYQAVADLLGLTPEEIEAQLEQGKSLAEIAAAKGVSEDDLVAAIIAPMREFMQSQVSAGNWTQAQLDAHLKLAEQHIRQLVNTSGSAYGCGGAAGGMMGGINSGASGFWGGMMGGNYGGMMGNGSGMMGGWGNNTNNQGSFGRGMMGGWY